LKQQEALLSLAEESQDALFHVLRHKTVKILTRFASSMYPLCVHFY